MISFWPLNLFPSVKSQLRACEREILELFLPHMCTVLFVSSFLSNCYHSTMAPCSFFLFFFLLPYYRVITCYFFCIFKAAQDLVETGAGWHCWPLHIKKLALDFYPLLPSTHLDIYLRIVPLSLRLNLDHYIFVVFVVKMVL